MQFLETVFYFVVTLGVLVFVHEFGHFLAAKLCSMRVDRFSIGFPPRAFGKKIGDTDYCVSWIPIGGYVKIAGMIDESLDTDYLNAPPQPWEFRARPLWQRMLVICAGVIMNVLLAVAIFWTVNYFQGHTVRQTTEIGDVVGGSSAGRAGLVPGDEILRVNGHPVTNWEEVLDDVYIETMGSDVTFVVRRPGGETEVVVPRKSIPEPDQASFGMIPAHTEIAVGDVDKGSAAEKLGLKPADILLSFNGVPIKDTRRVREIVHASAEKPLAVEWKRGDQIMSGIAVPNSKGLIGIHFGELYTGKVDTVHYTLFAALPQGIAEIGRVTDLFFRQIIKMITGKIAFSESVGGPVRIAQMATQSAEVGFFFYIEFMALLSISLALLNILPFPALDGGHLVFLIYEAIFRKEIPLKIRLGLQRAGIALLLAFMAIVLYNDIIHIF